MPQLTGLSVNTNQQLKAIDESLPSLQSLDAAKVLLSKQKENVDAVFRHTVEIVKSYNNLKQIHEVKFIKTTIPLPSPSIEQSYGSKLGYIKATIRFMSQALQHLMGVVSEGQKSQKLIYEALLSCERYDSEYPVLGNINDIDLELLEQESVVLTM